MQDLLKKYHALTEREQRLILISAVVLCIGLFYWLIWSPLNTGLENQRKAVGAKASELAWVKQNTARAIQLRGTASSRGSFSGSLPQAVNQTAARLRIAISRMQPQGEELKVWVDQAPFNDVLSWLQALENRGVRILDLDIAQGEAPGQIKVRNLRLGKS